MSGTDYYHVNKQGEINKVDTLEKVLSRTELDGFIWLSYSNPTKEELTMNGMILVMIINFDPSDFKDKGLYLIFPEGVRINLTKKNIQEVMRDFWEDTSKISQEVRKTIEFKRCDFCPVKEEDSRKCFIFPILVFEKSLFASIIILIAFILQLRRIYYGG